jgi:hypothetical protein
MKSLIILSFLTLAICLGPAGSGTPAAQSDKNKVDMTVMEFTEKTQLLGVTLLGKYVFIHDAQKKAEGKPCLFVYEYKGDAKTPLTERLGKQILAFHCEMVERPMAKIDVLTLAMGKDPGVFEIKEIQFAGTDKGHRVLAD